MPKVVLPEIEDVREPFCGCRRKNMVPLSVARPDIALEWCYEKNCGWGPEDLSDGSNVKVYWTCPDCLKDYKSTIKGRARGNRGCSYCGKKLLDPEKSLAKAFPELLSEWHYKKNGKVKPEDVFCGSHKRVWWRCSVNSDHVWEAPIYSRTEPQRKRGCPSCVGKKLSITNSLLANFPQIAESWHLTKNGKTKPDEVVYGSNKRYWWKCPRGHTWQASPNDRTRSLSGCPKCYRKRLPKLENSWTCK